jgi:hypothetical protein
MFAYFVQEAAPPHIDLTIRLSHYGLVEHPLKAVYGQVSASDIALWYKTHGNHLFSGNIRHFLGIRSDVNSGIASTLTNDPSVFWFFNNGITLIAEGLTRQAIGGNDRSIGVFECKNVTIVNGAQTVGTIGRTLTITDSPAFLHARIIVVDDPASDLGKRITRASNTQNRIDSRNFVALDPEQDRIRTELLIDKVYYEFREGEPLEKTVEGFEFIEAITTLACASTEMSYVALAKGYVGGLYADITTTPYRALFNSSTSSKRLWSLIKLSRKIDAAIREIHDPSSAERGIVVHGNRFLLHCTLREIFKSKTTSESDTMPADEIKECAGKILRLTKSAIEGNFPDAYLAPFFKNVSKCSEIRAVIESVNLPLIN